MKRLHELMLGAPSGREDAMLSRPDHPPVRPFLISDELRHLWLAGLALDALCGASFLWDLKPAILALVAALYGVDSTGRLFSASCVAWLHRSALMARDSRVVPSTATLYIDPSAGRDRDQMIVMSIVSEPREPRHVLLRLDILPCGGATCVTDCAHAHFAEARARGCNQLRIVLDVVVRPVYTELNYLIYSNAVKFGLQCAPHETLDAVYYYRRDMPACAANLQRVLTEQRLRLDNELHRVAITQLISELIRFIPQPPYIVYPDLVIALAMLVARAEE